MTKTAQSLTAQFRDIPWAFCLEVWGDALNTAGVSADADLRGTDKVYYLLALSIAPSFAPPSPDPTSASSAPKSTTIPTSTPFAGKEKEQQPPSLVVKLEPKDVVEVEQLKKKKKKKEKEVAA